MSDQEDQTPSVPSACWLVGGGEMGELIRSMDWSKTPLGPIESWPQSLKTAINIMLNSRYPMFVWWGDELINLYNNPYSLVLGKRHPAALGISAREVWADIWDILGPQAEGVLREGRATWNDEVLLVMERNNFTEETYFTWSYSPLTNDNGKVNGVFCACTEDTVKVVGKRRLKTLRDLGERTLEESKTAEDACRAAAKTLAENPYDISFVLVYLLDEYGQHAKLCGTAGLEAGTPPASHYIQMKTETDLWNLNDALATKKTQVIDNLTERFGRLTAGRWNDDFTRQAVVVPLAKSGVQEFPAGFLIAGISPRLRFDDDYRGFFDLVAGHISTTIANGRAYAEEYKRAEALAELDRAKTAFFSNVSHEFRTPLTLMLGTIEDTLADPATPSVIGARLEVGHRNSLRLLKLVNSLLDFSRIEAGRIQASYEATDLANLTAELASVFRAAIERAGMKFIVDCKRLSEPVYVDREMWEKIVLNLISNAFKYTLAGEIEVSLRESDEWRVESGEKAKATHDRGERDASLATHHSPQTTRSIVLTVRDTGIGIAEHELPHIFERFYRVEGAGGRTHEGSGIGLALVQELVKLHGGAISVDSVHAEGSAFAVRLPLGSAHLPPDRIGAARTLASTGIGSNAYVEEALRWLPTATDDKEEERLPISAAATASRSTGYGSRIIVADDNADMRDYIRRLLRPRYRVESAADGEAALAAARRERPDLMVIDVMMPGMDGFTLLRALRKDESLKSLPVIMLSARAGEESRVEGLQAGADDYLIKPFSARELLARVGAQLAIAHVRNEALEREHTLRAEAEKRVEARTWELEQANRALLHDMEERRKLEEQLLQAQKMESVGTLAGGIAHDFNNILNIIQGYAFTLCAHGPQEMAESLAVINETIQRGSALVQQLLTLARKTDATFEPVNANVIVEGLIPLAEQTFPKTLAIGADLQRDLPLMMADANQISQALLNLCLNARDAMPEGGRLILRTETVDGASLQNLDGGPTAGRYVCIEVIDTGIGMDESVRTRIFEPFFTTKEVGQGTGLGLAVVYGIVRNHNGFVDVQSKPMCGATFRLYIPVATADEKPATELNREAGVKTIDSRGHGRILVVEDESNMVSLLRKVLVRHGYQVVEATDGQTALDLYEREQDNIDAVLLDVGLPKKGGEDLLGKMKEKNPDIKVVVFSGYIEPELKSRMKQVGIEHFIDKPYLPDQIIQALQSLLHDQHTIRT